MNYRDVPGYFDFEAFYAEVVTAAPDASTLVEVGCWLGRSVIFLAEQVRASKKDIRIFAVDTWRGSPEHDKPDQMLIEQKHHGYIWHQFVNNIHASGVSDLITPMCLPSVEAAKYFEDGSVLMVYLDARHTYEFIKADIGAWRPKVKAGGTLAGHDCGWGGPGLVKRAVDESFSKVRLTGMYNSTWAVNL